MGQFCFQNCPPDKKAAEMEVKQDAGIGYDRNKGPDRLD